MFNRRKFLTGLLASPAVALAAPTPPIAERKIWVIVGVNWVHNDEWTYAEGDLHTDHAFREKESADRKCAELIEAFCAEEDIECFIQGDLALPDGWEELSLRQQWDWLFGWTPYASSSDEDCFRSTHGSVPVPYQVREMSLPISAIRQMEAAAVGRH